MGKKARAPKFETLISTPWGMSPDNSYYGDPVTSKKNSTDWSISNATRPTKKASSRS